MGREKENGRQKEEWRNLHTSRPFIRGRCSVSVKPWLEISLATLLINSCNWLVG